MAAEGNPEQCLLCSIAPWGYITYFLGNFLAETGIAGCEQAQLHSGVCLRLCACSRKCRDTASRKESL